MVLQSRIVFHFNEKKFVVSQHFPQQWFAVLWEALGSALQNHIVCMLCWMQNWVQRWMKSVRNTATWQKLVSAKQLGTIFLEKQTNRNPIKNLLRLARLPENVLGRCCLAHHRRWMFPWSKKAEGVSWCGEDQQDLFLRQSGVRWRVLGSGWEGWQYLTARMVTTILGPRKETSGPRKETS